MKEALYARAGDTGFTRSNTLLGKLIRYGETDKGEQEPTWANHTFVVVEDGWIGAVPESFREFDGGVELPLTQAVVIEALWKTRKGDLKLNGTEVRVFRPVPAYDEHELARFVAEAETFVGDKYGWWKLGFQLADKVLFRGKKVLTTALHIKGRPICSFLAGFVNQMAQGKERTLARVTAHLDRGDNGAAIYAFGMPPQAADPDEMMDYALANPTEWQEVK